MNIRAVILDADGVLIFPWRFAEYLGREFGITREITGEFFRGEFNGCLIGKKDLKDVLPPYLDAWGWEGSTEEFLHLWLTIEDALDKRIVETVQTWKQQGYVCCLATNQEQHRAEYMKKTMGLSKLFDRLFFSCELGIKKPDAQYYEAIEAALGLRGEEIGFWDDSPSYVDAAKRRGWQAEIYTGYEDFKRQRMKLQEKNKT
jgi:putative hydrolase of the HAD superfamily